MIESVPFLSYVSIVYLEIGSYHAVVVLVRTDQCKREVPK